MTSECCSYFRRFRRLRFFVFIVSAYAATTGISVYSMYHSILPFFLHDLQRHSEMQSSPVNKFHSVEHIITIKDEDYALYDNYDGSYSIDYLVNIKRIISHAKDTGDESGKDNGSRSKSHKKRADDPSANASHSAVNDSREAQSRVQDLMDNDGQLKSTSLVSNTAAKNATVSHDDVKHVPGSHDDVQDDPGSHDDVQHVPGSQDDVQHVPGNHDDVKHVPGSYDDVKHVPGSHATDKHLADDATNGHDGESHDTHDSHAHSQENFPTHSKNTVNHSSEHRADTDVIARQIAIITGTGAVAQMFMSLLSGVLLERFSIRLNLLFGSALLVLSTVLTYFADGVVSMCGAYATASCGQLLSFTAMYSYYNEYALDQRELNKLAGCYVIFQNTGFILGYSAVSASYQFFGREATMLGLIGLMIPDILLRLCLVPNATEMIDITPPENVDYVLVGQEALEHKINYVSDYVKFDSDSLSMICMSKLTLNNGQIKGEEKEFQFKAQVANTLAPERTSLPNVSTTEVTETITSKATVHSKSLEIDQSEDVGEQDTPTQITSLLPPEKVHEHSTGELQYEIEHNSYKFRAPEKSYTNKIRDKVNDTPMTRLHLGPDTPTVIVTGEVTEDDRKYGNSSGNLTTVRHYDVDGYEDEEDENEIQKRINGALPVFQKWVRFLQNPYVITFMIQVFLLNIVSPIYWGTAPDYVMNELNQELWMIGVVMGAGQIVNLISILGITVVVTTTRRRWIALLICHILMAAASIWYPYTRYIWGAAVPDAMFRSCYDVIHTLLTTLLPFICECENVGDSKMSYALMGAVHSIGMVLGYYACGELVVRLTFKWLYISMGVGMASVALLFIPYAWLKPTIMDESFQEEIDAVSVSFADLRKSNIGLAELTASKQVVSANANPGLAWPRSRSASTATLASHHRSRSVSLTAINQSQAQRPLGVKIQRHIDQILL